MKTLSALMAFLLTSTAFADYPCRGTTYADFVTNAFKAEMRAKHGLRVLSMMASPESSLEDVRIPDRDSYVRSNSNNERWHLVKLIDAEATLVGGVKVRPRRFQGVCYGAGPALEGIVKYKDVYNRLGEFVRYDCQVEIPQLHVTNSKTHYAIVDAGKGFEVDYETCTAVSGF